MRKKGVFFLLAFVAVIAACTPVAVSPTLVVEPTFTLTATPSPSKIVRFTETATSILILTDTPTFPPTLTSTPMPPLVAHEWQPQTVLAKLESGGGDGCCEYSYPPDLVLYANGRLIITRSEEVAGKWIMRLFTKRLDRQATCGFLNTIDQAGFLDYDPSTYKPKGGAYSVDGSDYTRITVNAWSHVDGEFYGLTSYTDANLFSFGFAQNEIGVPLIPPALRDTYYFLNSYFPSGLEEYQPERLGIVVMNKDAVYSVHREPIRDWPFPEVNLDEIERQTTIIDSTYVYTDKFFELNGTLAKSVYRFFDDSITDAAVRQNGKEYAVFVRPLLPYEVAKFHDFNVIPDPNIQPPSFRLNCYPSDGLLPILSPTPWK
jgi:hypothetical protein